MHDILIREGHPKWLCDKYYKWVGKDFMRTRWEKKHGIDRNRIHAELTRKTAHLLDHPFAR